MKNFNNNNCNNKKIKNLFNNNNFTIKIRVQEFIEKFHKKSHLIRIYLG